MFCNLLTDILYFFNMDVYILAPLKKQKNYTQYNTHCYTQCYFFGSFSYCFWLKMCYA